MATKKSKSQKPKPAKAVASAAKPVKRQAKPVKKPAASKAAKAAQTPGLWDRATQFLREVVQELKRVTWPSRRQTLSTTGVVIALVFLVSIFLGVVDFALSRLVRLIIG